MQDCQYYILINARLSVLYFKKCKTVSTIYYEMQDCQYYILRNARLLERNFKKCKIVSTIF